MNTSNRGNDSITFSKNLLKEVRVSFCVPEEMINKAFDRMEKYFKKNR